MVYAWTLAHLDWEAECDRAQTRIEEEEEGANDAAALLAAADSDLEDEAYAEMREERKRHGFMS
jgi:hypothetical protein